MLPKTIVEYREKKDNTNVQKYFLIFEMSGCFMQVVFFQ